MTGIIYVIGADWRSPIKIGVTRDVAKRLMHLQSASPAALRPLWQSEPLDDPFGFETALHALYSEHRVRGEWFLVPKITPSSLADAVASIAAAKPARDIGIETQVCCLAVAELIEMRQRSHGINVADAMSILAQDAKLDHGTVWNLRYRPPVDVKVSIYARIASLVWSAATRPKPIKEVPSAREFFEAIKLLPLPPTPARLRLVAQMEEFLRNSESEASVAAASNGEAK